MQQEEMKTTGKAEMDKARISDEIDRVQDLILEAMEKDAKQIKGHLKVVKVLVVVLAIATAIVLLSLVGENP